MKHHNHAVSAKTKRGAASRTRTSHEDLLAAVRLVLRGQSRSELPAHGIDVMFDDGVVAVCRACRLAWDVKRAQFANPAWWSCPRGCKPGHTAPGAAHTESRC